MFTRLIRRLTYWMRFRAQQAELAEELALHRELLADDLRRQGLSPDAAAAVARRAMGNETLMREDARGVWLASGLDAVQRDIRYAVRGLRRSPMFGALVVMIVALVVGANTAVFSVVKHVLLAPLPYPDGNRIVRLGMESAADPLAAQFGISTELLHRASARSRTLEELAAGRSSQARLGDDRDAPPIAAAAITPSFLPLLRVRPALGRGFTAEDVRAGAPPTVMLGFGLWQRRYALARDVVGRIVMVNGAPRTIIGVLPSEVDLPMSMNDLPEIWLPLDLAAVTTVEGFARLRRGTTSAAASAELQSIARELPDNGKSKGLRVTASRAQDRLDPRAKRAVQLLFATVCGLLLVACANVANLLLMRGWTRRRELAVRLALGAGRARLARQLMIESVLLAGIGGALGLLMAWRGLRAIVRLYPGGLISGTLSSLDAVHIDATVLLWTVGVSVGIGLLVGVGPAFLSADASLGDALRTGGRTAVGSGGARRLRNGLVVAELAVSLVFLAAAGLLVRSFVALAHTPIGLDPVGLVNVEVRLATQPAPADRASFEQALATALRAVPGVTDVAFGGGLAMTDVRAGPFAIDGASEPQVIDLPFCEMPFVSPEYFRVARIPILRGRSFERGDPAAAARELVINDALARRLWPGGSALGSRLRVVEPSGPTWLTVVGVVGDVHLPGVTGDLFNLQMYRATSAAPRVVGRVVLRVNGRETALDRTLRNTVEGAGWSAKLGTISMTESVIDRRVLARPRFALVVFAAFAMIALLVSAAGLYGIIAYAVTQRTREIGVRIALGAEPQAVAQLVLGDSARLVAVGVGLGLVGAYAASRLLGAFLYNVAPSDPASLGGAVLLMTGVALVATAVPLRRALRIDPLDALRTD